MSQDPRRALLLADVDQVMHIPQHGLQEQERDDDGAEDRVAVGGLPLVRHGGHPCAEPECGHGDEVGEDLHAGVGPDNAFEGGEADEEDAEGHEQDECDAHEGGVDDHYAVVVGGRVMHLLGAG